MHRLLPADELAWTHAVPVTKPYSRTSTGLPPDAKFAEGPVVIVLPPSLIGQWEADLHRWLEPGSINILKYGGVWNRRKRERWWTEVYGKACLDGSKRQVILMNAKVRVVCPRIYPVGLTSAHT